MFSSSTLILVLLSSIINDATSSSSYSCTNTIHELGLLPTYTGNNQRFASTVSSLSQHYPYPIFTNIHTISSYIETYIQNCPTVTKIIVHLEEGIHSLLSQTLVFNNPKIPSTVQIEYRGSSTGKSIISGGYTLSSWVPLPEEPAVLMTTVNTTTTMYTRQLYINNTRVNMTYDNPSLYGLGSDQNITITSTGIIINPNYTSIIMNSQLVNNGLVELIFSHSFQQSRCTVMNYTLLTNQSINLIMAQPCWTFGRSLNQVGYPTAIYNARTPMDLLPGTWTNDHQGTIYYKPIDINEYNNLLNNTIQGTVPEVDTLLVVANTNNYLFTNITFEYSGYANDYNVSNGYIERYGGVQYLPCLTTENCFNSTLSPAAGCGNENCWLEMQHSAVRIINSTNIGFTNIIFTHLGLHGLGIFDGSKNINISECLFMDLSGGGLHVGNVNQTQSSNENEQNINFIIQDNVFENIGLEYQGSIPISTFAMINGQILHNFIGSSPYTGISFNWPVPQTTSYSNYNLLSGNKVTQSCYWGGDGGAVHTIGPSLNTIIENNYFYNQSGGHAAIYIDNTSDFYNVTLTVVENADMWLYFQQSCNPANRSQCGNVGHDNHAWDCYVYNAPPSPFPYDSNNCTVTDITYLNTTQWPPEAQNIINQAGPRAGTRYYKYGK